MPTPARRLFALDHNFPEPILEALASSIPQAELVPIRRIGGDLAELDDWQVMLALYRDERSWDGIITNDDAILSLPKELTVLSQTGLTLVVARGEGHNPVKATGLLLCHLGHICQHTTPGKAQVWRLRAAQKPAEDVRSYLEEIAEREGKTVADLVAMHKLPAGGLQKKPAR